MELHRPLSTVTPTLDGDVLAVLARSDVAFTTGQLRRLLEGPSEEGVRKVLQRLTKQGVVSSTRVGNVFSYQLNRDHLAAEHIIGLARLQEQLLDRLSDRLASWRIKPVFAAVFGSAATGSMTVGSDLDLLIVFPVRHSEEEWREQVDELAAEVTRWTGNDTRPVEFAETEIVGRSRDPLMMEVVNRGIPVIGSRSWLLRRLRQTRV
jgi:predicted nucleotidyltransferase